MSIEFVIHYLLVATLKFQIHTRKFLQIFNERWEFLHKDMLRVGAFFSSRIVIHSKKDRPSAGSSHVSGVWGRNNQGKLFPVELINRVLFLPWTPLTWELSALGLSFLLWITILLGKKRWALQSFQIRKSIYKSFSFRTFHMNYFNKAKMVKFRFSLEKGLLSKSTD